MLKKTIYLVIELKVREFVAKLLFSYFAVKRGYRVYLGSREKIIDLVNKKKDKGGIFFYKAGLQVDKTKLISFKINNHIVLDEEITGGLNKDRYLRSTKSFFPETKKYIHGYFYINKKVSSIVKKTIKQDNVYGFGWPRVDLYRKPFSDIYQEKVIQIKKKYGKFYLFMSDLGFITKNYKEYALEYFPWGGNKVDKEYYKEFALTKAKNSFEEFQTLVPFFKTITSRTNDPKILIRGHPAENLEEWKKNIKNSKNLIFLQPRDDPQPWIMAAEGVLHRGCSTSLQAYALNKKIGYIKLKKKIDKRLIKRFPYNLSYKIKSKKDFIDWTRIKKYNDLSKIKNELNLSQGKYSCELILDKIDTFKVDKENNHKKIINRVTPKDKLNFYSNKIKQLLFFYLVKLRLLKRNIDKFYLISKIPNGIKAKEAHYFMNKFKYFKKLRFKIKQIDNDLIEIDR